MTKKDLKKMTKMVERVVKAEAVPEVFYKNVEFSEDEQEFLAENEDEFYNALDEELGKEGMTIDDPDDELMVMVRSGYIYTRTCF